MLDLNLSVKVLDPKAPYLFVWWNDADGCADGLMVTCKCQGYLHQQTVDIKAPEWHTNLVKAMQQAEIVTVHPQRNGTSLCKLSDVVAVQKETSKESKGKRKKKKKGQKKKKAKTKTSKPEEGDDGSQEQGGGGGEIVEPRKDEEQMNEAEDDSQPTDIIEELTDEGLNVGHDSELDVTAADVDDNEFDAERVGNGEVEEVRADNGEVDEERVAVEPVGMNEEASAVPISISSMSETIRDMLSPLEEAARELLPAESILSPLPQVPDPQDSTLESDNKVAELKVLKDKKYLEGYNHKLQNRKITVILCEICGAATSNKSFKKHMDAVHMNGQMEGFHKCSICQKEFAYSANLRRHELIHYNTRFHCSICGKSFSQSGSCKNHERKVHGCRKTVTTMTKSDTVTKLTTWPHYKLATRSSVIAQCKICGKKVKRTSMRSHMETHNPQGVSCPVCHKRYSSSNSLRIHSVVHKERKYQCSVCGKRFHHSFGLVIHMRIHNNDKPLTCRYCDEKFSRYQARINHERRHTGEKPYCCFICVKNWRDRTTYLQHMRRHHPNEPLMTLRKQPPPAPGETVEVGPPS